MHPPDSRAPGAVPEHPSVGRNGSVRVVGRRCIERHRVARIDTSRGDCKDRDGRLILPHDDVHRFGIPQPGRVGH